jgi:beta-lactamase regulating signal transducer with metallopeptidase domain
MYTLLPHILNMSFTAAIVIVIVLFVRLPLKRAPKIFSYALWAVVLFRLVCPVSLSSQFSLLGLLPTSVSSSGSSYSSMDYIPADIVHTATPHVNLPLPGISEFITGNLPQGEEQLVADPLEAPMAALTILWLSGIAAILIYNAVSFIHLRRKLIGTVRLRDNIYLTDHIVSPFVIGIFRPKIYLPSTLPEEEQSYVILHEQTHIRRLDHIYKMLAFIALAAHWFNPLVWVAFVCCGKDMEMSCDERVLMQMGCDIREAYGASLLSLATGRRHINGSSPAFGEGNIRGRINNIINFKKPAFWISAAAVALVITAGAVLLLNPIPVEAKAPSMGYMVAFVDETLPEAEARALQSLIEKNPNVEHADFETREEAMKRFESKFSDESLFESIDSSSFRHRYYVYICDNSLSGQTVNDISHLDGIVKVSTGT